MTVTFPRWPVWNFQFPEKDVQRIVSVKYRDQEDAEQELDRERYRLAIGRSGVSVLVLMKKGMLPPLFDRTDAVVIEYEA